MVLLEMMPLIWLSSIWLLVLAAMTGSKCSFSLSTGVLSAFGASLGGLPPWIQVLVFAAFTAIFSLFQRLCSPAVQTVDDSEAALVIAWDNAGGCALVLVRGQIIRAIPGCFLIDRPVCGDLVQLMKSEGLNVHFFCQYPACGRKKDCQGS